MSFERFTRDKAVPRGDPMVTITSYGRLALNKAATARLEASGVKYVHLLWDAETHRVGIESTEKDRDAHLLTYGNNGNGAGFSAVRFLSFIQYDWSNTKNFSVEWDSSLQMYVFTVPDASLGKVMQIGKVKRVGNPTSKTEESSNKMEATEVAS